MSQLKRGFNKNIISDSINFTFIIRASGEATTQKLLNQIKTQKNNNDSIYVLDDFVCFEDKLKQGYELAIQKNNEFTVFVDADILLRKNAIKNIRKYANYLEESDLGFGLLLWDKFYEKTKYRGLHVYRTIFLNKAINFIPNSGEQIRPESFVKKVMMKEGHNWRNNITKYVVGVHDFYQKPEDIYYKFWIRSKRSAHDTKKLKIKFSKKQHLNEFIIALKGLSDGEGNQNIINDKFDLKNKLKFKEDENKIVGNTNIDYLIIKNLILKYGLRKKFWNYI